MIAMNLTGEDIKSDMVSNISSVSTWTMFSTYEKISLVPQSTRSTQLTVYHAAIEKIGHTILYICILMFGIFNKQLIDTFANEEILNVGCF